MNTALTKRPERDTLEEILKRPAYAERFKQVLGEKASQFCSSLVSIGRSMPDVEPKSIVGSAMVAACLDLPIEKNLGFAWIVPYKKGDQKYAQFQMGYKGYVQLAQRTGYYAGMNACTINKEAYRGRDNLGEPIIDWDQVDETKEAVGYFFGFKMINGFIKGCYWTKAKVIAHAKQYSQSYRGGYDSPWKSHFDKMALKTVIANELSDWGILSVQFQLARKNDQALVKDIDADAEYIDTDGDLKQVEDSHKPTPTAFQQATQGTSGTKPEEKTGEKKPEPAKYADQGPGLGDDNVPFEASEPSKTAQDASGATQTPSGGEKPQDGQNAAQGTPKSEAPTPTEALPEPDPAFNKKEGDTDELASVKVVALNAGISYEGLMKFLRSKKLAREDQQLEHLSSKKLLDISRHMGSWINDIRGQK